MTPSHGTRRPGHRRGATTFAVVLLALALGVLSAAIGSAQAATVHVPSSQPLALLLSGHATRATPGPHGHRLGNVTATRPLTGVHTVLPVLGRATASDGSPWLHVRLPGRPSGHTGWISAFGTRASSTGWAIVVRLSARSVAVYERGRLARRFSAVVGKPSTPTPRGRFFVEESMALAGAAAGAPFALATSARSHVLQEFDGGPGQIALHGMGHLAGAPGTAVSHGCIRLTDAAITWMARRIGAGVPVRVLA
ncbi:MAG: L,D-transpeptidase [Conexibacter sp.]|nr:L,D-transpeptidase [Conexibacter sp.]